MPMGEYKDFSSCVAANQDKEDPDAYCGEIKKRTEDKKEQVIFTNAMGQQVFTVREERETPSGKTTDKPYGVPKTDEERKATHKKLYGNENIPPRGTGLKKED